LRGEIASRLTPASPKAQEIILKKLRRTVACAVVCAGTLAIGAAGTSAKTVDSGDSGRTVSIAQGQTLLVRLPSANSGSTGYSWSTTKAPAKSVLKLVSDKTVGDEQRFSYRAKAIGRTTLTLRYFPPGRGAKAVKTFRLTVKVRAAR
jgi:predicted secreted protein